MNRLIIMGSPRSNGRCAHLAEMLFEACIDECPEDELFLVPVSELHIEPCVGCGACRSMAPHCCGDTKDPSGPDTSEGEDGAYAEDVETAITTPAGASDGEKGEAAAFAGGPDAGKEEPEAPDYPYCPRFDDDMQDVYPLLPAADELIIVAPVYFSGAPSSLKALLDRLQPHFWAQTRKAAKRPEALHVVGEGGDPHGYGPLVSEVKSATACAGFRLERVLDWVGKIDQHGEIVAEATELTIVQAQAPASIADAGGTTSPERPKLSFGAEAGRGAAEPKRNRGEGKGETGKPSNKGKAAQGTANKEGKPSKGGKPAESSKHGGPSGRSTQGGKRSGRQPQRDNRPNRSAQRGKPSQGNRGHGPSKGGRRG